MFGSPGVELPLTTPSTLSNGPGSVSAPPKLSFVWATKKKQLLVGGFNPFQTYARQIGSFPQIGDEN